MNFSTAIIGAGKLGSALALAFHKQNVLKYIVDNSEIARGKAKSLIDDFSAILSSIEHINVLPQLIFLTVSDDLIEQTAQNLADTFGNQLKGKFIIHCSGSLSLKVLSSCKQYGAFTVAVHPYQTFFKLSDNLLSGIAWSIRSESNTDIIESLIKKTGGKPYVIKDDESLLSFYHSSAVVSSNFMTSLISLAREIANFSEIDGNKFMPPIISTTIENNFNADEFPLTGPYARGDIETIERHLKALSKQPQLKRAYVYMALATLEQIQFHKSADDNIVNEMREILNKNLK